MNEDTAEGKTEYEVFNYADREQQVDWLEDPESCSGLVLGAQQF